MKYFEYLLEGSHFTTKTDLKPITHGIELKLEKSSDRQRQKIDYIFQFFIDLIYLTGEDNIVVDTLSRINSNQMPPKHSTWIN